eukprot:7530862-Pyramimonas_sp.AAC.1
MVASCFVESLGLRSSGAQPTWTISSPAPLAVSTRWTCASSARLSRSQRQFMTETQASFPRARWQRWHLFVAWPPSPHPPGSGKWCAGPPCR